MGTSSSSGSSGGGNHLVKNNKYDLPIWYMKERFHLSGDVWIYSSRMAGLLGATKHHGIIVSIPSETHYWCFERFSECLELTRGQTTNGTYQKSLGNYTVKAIC